MKSKILGLFGLSIFIVAVFAVFASAATSSVFTITNVNAPANVDEDDGSFTFTFNLTYTGNSTDMDISFADSTSSIGDISIPTAEGMDGTISESRTITGTITNFAGQAWNTAVVVINATGDSSRDDETTFSVSFINSFCSNGAVNDTNLVLNVDINNNGEGDDDKWIPLDTIEIEVELENNNDLSGNGDLNDVIFELGLFREGSTSDIMDNMMWLSDDDEKVKVGDIDEDESEKYLFKFRVDPTEVKDDSYVLRVKAYPKGEESDTCIDHSVDLDNFGSSEFFAKIDISTEDDKDKMVVVDESSYPSIINAFCGEQVSLPVDVYNIGDKDFDDQIKVALFNSELGISEEETVLGDFREGDKAEVTFLFKVPEDAEENTYPLLMETFYDYDKDNDVYDRSSDETFTALLKVEGNCKIGIRRKSRRRTGC